jgi:hypothetical protein
MPNMNGDMPAKEESFSTNFDTPEGYALAQDLAGKNGVRVWAVKSCSCGCGNPGVGIEVDGNLTVATEPEVIDQLIASLQEAKSFAFGPLCEHGG